MKILSIDTSTNIASVCLTENKSLISQVNFNCIQNHSSILMPIISQLFENSKINISEIEFIACVSGPGSFTGLRVGASTAKALALTLDKKIISVGTLDTLAYNMYKTNKTIIPIIDAKAYNVFFSLYNFDEKNNLVQKLKPKLICIYDLLEYLKVRNINPIFVGDAVNFYKSIIQDFDNNFELADEYFNIQNSYSLAKMAYDYANLNKYLNYYEFKIDYIRKAQAEIDMEERLVSYDKSC